MMYNKCLDIMNPEMAVVVISTGQHIAPAAFVLNGIYGYQPRR
jgi:hypothetical protein